MRLIFCGLLLVFLDVTVAGAVDVLPDFIGFILIAVGMLRTTDCALYQERRRTANAMAVISAVTWILSLMGAAAPVTVLSIVGLILQLYILYLIAQGVQELEEQADADWGAAKMLSAWKVITLAAILQAIFGFLIPAVGLLAALVGLAAFVVYLYYDHRAVKGHEG